MSKSGDYPPGLTSSEKKIFVIFDVIDNRGTAHEAAKEISRRLRFRPPHRTTITPVFKAGLELFKEDPLVLTDERINEVCEKVGYGIPSSRVVNLYRLYLLWKAYRRKEIVNIDLILSTLRERRLKVWFLLLQHWDEEEIAEKLGILLQDVQHDIKETGKALVNETKEESRMEQNQSMLNLPPWVNRAQWEHLEGREQHGELGEGIGVTTYPGGIVTTYPGGIGIRQQLELFRGYFPEIAPRNRSFGQPLDEIIAAQLRGHLPDKAFWSRVEDFWEKAKKCTTLLDAAYEKFTSAGEELVRSSASGLARITSGWERQAVYRVLGPPLGFKSLPQYLVGISKEGGSTLTCYELLYSGPDAADAEKAKQKHQQLVDDFEQTDGFKQIVSLMKELQNLRPQILARIDQCLRRSEYSYYYCPDCPADQARKMLLSDK